MVCLVFEALAEEREIEVNKIKCDKSYVHLHTSILCIPDHCIY